MTKHQGYLFFTFALIFIVSTFLKPYPLSWIIKTLPIVILIAYSLTRIKTIDDKWFVAGLFFSLFGDILLDVDRDKLFVFGLGSFLFAHLCYIRSLLPLTLFRWSNTLTYVLLGVVMFYLLGDKLGELFIPVLVYMVVLLMMGISTLLSKKSNKWLIIGGGCFALSDGLIGLNKFYIDIPNESFWIMLSYYFAQYALVKGMFLSQLTTNKD